MGPQTVELKVWQVQKQAISVLTLLFYVSVTALLSATLVSWTVGQQL